MVRCFFFAGGLLALLLAPFFLRGGLGVDLPLDQYLGDELLDAGCVHLTTPPEEVVDGTLFFFVGGLLALLLLLFRIAGVVLGAQHDGRGTEKAERAR